MGTKIQYALLYAWVKIHALLPMRMLYVLSDILYFLIYKVIKYRIKVVRRNLAASFPEKSEAERLCIEKGFYHHFADYMVETLKLAHISLEELQRRGTRTSVLHPVDGAFRQLGMVFRFDHPFSKCEDVSDLPPAKEQGGRQSFYLVAYKIRFLCLEQI